MQFGIGGLAGNTWGGAPIHPASEHTGGYGIDGDHDGIVNVYDPGDAIPSAAAFLKAHGAPANIQAALFAYNHSDRYVTDVLDQAARYAAGGTQVLTAEEGPACEQADLGPLPAGTAGKVIAYAEAQLGKPYLWGATGPDAFDCSGLAMMAYRAAGITIPRTSQQQWASGPQIPASQAQPGDLVFFAGSDGTMTAPGHVGIVTGHDTMIDAPRQARSSRGRASAAAQTSWASPAPDHDNRMYIRVLAGGRGPVRGRCRGEDHRGRGPARPALRPHGNRVPGRRDRDRCAAGGRADLLAQGAGIAAGFHCGRAWATRLATCGPRSCASRPAPTPARCSAGPRKAAAGPRSPGSRYPRQHRPGQGH